MTTDEGVPKCASHQEGAADSLARPNCISRLIYQFVWRVDLSWTQGFFVHARKVFKTLVAIIALFVMAANSGWAQQQCPPGNQLSTPTSQFVNHGNGTLTHTPTGLMWKRCLEGQSGMDCADGSAIRYNWNKALQLADSHVHEGYSDWRLPNIKELASIVETGCISPAINLNVFPNDLGKGVWSNSPSELSAGNYVWIVNFFDGNVYQEQRYSVTQYLQYLRLVRSGK